ncbi:HepT-like ribonuclease domain-containing protein [Bradyrhizobium sp. ISRA443]|uniref:HepT-like ribonuclease domain-containing protein n=1 Tax=unclassified Bradyrhizobium TaxID=2631580 RepID=UPI0032AE9483
MSKVSIVRRLRRTFDPSTQQTRCLEIISEASRRLPADLKARHPGIVWKQMAGAGNVYRHDYEDVAAQFVWDTVELALPPLRAVVEQEIVRLTG